ncbi:DUF4129 domain-containing protein [Saccharomonospora sp. CUA-673]|uniref:DUF4129 domain-containing protein n=1 Tax=Saccharomonospora sp. CUA-673 TaxID=1904969 RepID=UPI002101B7AD|nr:DUF4129 domain-containing protein [Saccharomonospora sp. CUA-673]
MLLGGRRFVTGGPPVSTAVAAAVGGAWAVSLVLAGWLLHWAVPLVVLLGVAALLGPAATREFGRRRRLAEVSRGTPASADAAWREVLAECADRGLDIPSTETLRQARDTITDRLALDDEGRRHLSTIVQVVERSWYSPTGAAGAGPSAGAGLPGGTEPNLAEAVEGLRAAMDRHSPLPWRGQLVPRSLLSR